MPVSAQHFPTCALCMLPVDETTMLRVLAWGIDHPEASVSEDATDDEAALAIVHRACFVKVMHPDYQL